MAQTGGGPKVLTRKDLKNFESLSRQAFISHFRAAGVSAVTPTYNRLSAFLPKKLWAWISHVVQYWGNAKHAFKDYTQVAGDTGVYPMDDRAKVSLAGDWGTGTDEAEEVAVCIQKFGPDFTIHLGDVYYVGDDPEVKENCLGEKTSPFDPVTWPMGSKGSFALNGNHEMYANGNAYFDVLLKKLGPRVPGAQWGYGQKASFFCLENNFWRIIGLDTGYNSTGIDVGGVPLLKKSKWLRKTTWFKPSCKLPDPLRSWLRSAVKPDADKRGIILLSHHEYYSSFDDWYQHPAKQLAELIHRPVLWFWGHEHRLAIYDKYGVQDGITAYGRCVGHGGMPVSRGVEPDIEDCRWLAYDNRPYSNSEGIDVGYNGSVNLAFDRSSLRVEYRDLKSNLLLTENWQIDLVSGDLGGPNLQVILQDPELRHR